METDPLQQLKDIHLPPDPGWWPPAPGWWLLGLLALALCVWGIVMVVRYYRARRPLRLARAHLVSLYAGYQADKLSALEFAHGCNELLKRLLVRALGRDEFAVMTGSGWLEALDGMSDSEFFTSGHGQVLGHDRFQLEPLIDADSLHSGVKDLLDRDLVKQLIERSHNHQVVPVHQPANGTAQP